MDNDKSYDSDNEYDEQVQGLLQTVSNCTTIASLKSSLLIVLSELFQADKLKSKYICDLEDEIGEVHEKVNKLEVRVNTLDLKVSDISDRGKVIENDIIDLNSRLEDVEKKNLDNGYFIGKVNKVERVDKDVEILKRRVNVLEDKVPKGDYGIKLITLDPKD